MKWRIVEELERRRVDIMTEIQLDEINSRGLVIISKAGIKKLLISDNIIIATGAEPDKSLFDTLQGKAKEILLAGDCNKLSYIKDSVADGARIGSLI
jgi:thioredoxin reductase